jgi:hypothetical protein
VYDGQPRDVVLGEQTAKCFGVGRVLLERCPTADRFLSDDGDYRQAAVGICQRVVEE